MQSTIFHVLCIFSACVCDIQQKIGPLTVAEYRSTLHLLLCQLQFTMSTVSKMEKMVAKYKASSVWAKTCKP